MSEHTPGPWTADWDDSGQWYVNIGGLAVSGTALRGDSTDCLESANARLIAAAPELLDALKRASAVLLNCQDDTIGTRSEEVFRDEVAKIDAVLRKAEGRDA